MKHKKIIQTHPEQSRIMEALSNIREEAATFRGEMGTSIEVLKVQMLDTRGDVGKLSEAVVCLNKKLQGNGTEGLIEKGNRLDRELTRVHNTINVIPDIKNTILKYNIYIAIAAGASTVLGAVGIVFLGEFVRNFVSKIF